MLLNLLIVVGEFSGLVGPSVSSVSRCMLRAVWIIATDSWILLSRSTGFMLMNFCNVSMLRDSKIIINTHPRPRGKVLVNFTDFGPQGVCQYSTVMLLMVNPRSR